MNATDLRIGNYVLIPSHNNKSIPLIPCIEKKIKGINQFSELDFTEPTYLESHEVHVNHCAGIPLTKEILVDNCGFEYRIEKLACRIFILNSVEVYKMLGSYPFIFNNSVFDIEIKHLHQLQNLYFVLTGKELEIKL